MSRLFSHELGFRSDTCEWGTPPDLFAELDLEFGFTLDVCASSVNHKCARFYAKEDDAFSQPWEGVCWMNPPYGRDIGRWVARAWRASQGGGNRGLPASCAHRHGMVARIRHEGRGPLPARQTQVHGGRWPAARPRAVPVRRSHLPTWKG